jgi:hypothetical protein
MKKSIRDMNCALSLQTSLFLVLACLLFPAAKSDAQEPLPPGIEIDLKDQLERGLKARLPAEFEYLDRIALLVKERRLPLELVLSTFQYARHKRPYPIQYFHRALMIRAERIGIAIDLLDLGPPIPG